MTEIQCIFTESQRLKFRVRTVRTREFFGEDHRRPCTMALPAFLMYSHTWTWGSPRPPIALIPWAGPAVLRGLWASLMGFALPEATLTRAKCTSCEGLCRACAIGDCCHKRAPMKTKKWLLKSAPVMVHEVKIPLIYTGWFMFNVPRGARAHEERRSSYRQNIDTAASRVAYPIWRFKAVLSVGLVGYL